MLGAMSRKVKWIEEGLMKNRAEYDQNTFIKNS